MITNAEPSKGIILLMNIKIIVMKSFYLKIAIISLMLLFANACKKQELESVSNEMELRLEEGISAVVYDSISSAATHVVEGRKFIRKAQVNMEVKDVYDATISIEKILKDLGGFVTRSELKSIVYSQRTYEISDTESMQVKKFKTTNNMEVHVPSEYLGDFLTTINKEKAFLNTRVIIAEDVTHNTKIAQLEAENNRKMKEVISQMKNNADKVEYTQNVLEEDKNQKIKKLALADNLKYALVTIDIEEPNYRIAEIAIENTKSIEAKYKVNFFHETKTAWIEGFYFTQKFIIFFVTLWPLWLTIGIVFFIFKKFFSIRKSNKEESSES